MADPEYIYNDHSWSPCATEDEGHSFFHAVYGVTDGDDRPYKDKDERFRRKCWLNFLAYFNGTSIPTDLMRMLHIRLSTHACSEDNYHEYVGVVSQPDYRIVVEDIPILSVVGNVKVAVFTDKNEHPTIVTPNPQLLGFYPLRTKADLVEAVIYFDGCKFSKMLPRSEIATLARATLAVADIVPDSVPQKAEFNKLSGNAGIKGSLYQVNLLTIFLLNGLRKRNRWRLSTENADSGKFDDLVFELLPSGSAILLQAKHRKNKFRRISCDELFSTNTDKDDFSLPKYFFSYQEVKSKFKVQNVVICTNVDLNNRELSAMLTSEKLNEDHMLHYEGVRSVCYKFNTHVLPRLKNAIEEYSQNARNCAGEFTEDDMKEFLEHLQFIANYPSESDLDQVVKRILSSMEFCTRFESKDFSKYIIKKMIEWFEEEKGRYMTEINAKALFSEIRSNKFCEKLHNCNLFVKDNTSLPTTLPKILCVVSQRGYVLNMIKIYVALHGENETLFVNPRDDIEVQKQIVEAFEIPRYTILVACLAKAPDDVITHVCRKLTEILNKFSYKKVVLISKRNDKLAEGIKEANAGNYEEIEENITFNDLTEESQERVLGKVIQFFHVRL